MTTTSVPVDRDEIWRSVESRVQGKAFLRGGWIRKQWLPGDASNRFYARAFCADGSSQMVMIMNAPEAFKSEEVTGSGIVWKELPFVAIARRLRQEGVRTPDVFFVAPQNDFLVLEDLGDELLYERRQRELISQGEASVVWYEKALDELARLQQIKDLAKGISFTRDLLAWEAEHFVEYAIEKRQKKIAAGALKELRGFLSKLVDRMASSSYVLCHRDFHSKNLLILEKESRVGLIDFQDALWGPPVYDLASLLRDSYVTLTLEEEAHLLRYFGERTQRVDHELYAMTSLQRNLKAIGRFFYISMVKGRDTHLPYVRPSLERVMKTLKDLNEKRVIAIMEGLMNDELQGHLH